MKMYFLCISLGGDTFTTGKWTRALQSRLLRCHALRTLRHRIVERVAMHQGLQH